jgi:hypothetical protein
MKKEERRKREEKRKKKKMEEMRREALSQDADSTASRKAELKKKICCALAKKNCPPYRIPACVSVAETCMSGVSFSEMRFVQGKLQAATGGSYRAKRAVNETVSAPFPAAAA